MISRRTFLASSLLPLGAFHAAAADRPPARVGYLQAAPTVYDDSFWNELNRLGYVNGDNLRIEYRSAEGDFGRLRELADDLVARRVDVIVAVVTQASLAATAATSTIPIVMIGVGDPVASGLVSNLARPGGNVTGTSTTAVGVIGKQLELLRQIVPRAAAVAVLHNPANATFQRQLLEEIESAAAALRVGVRVYDARSVPEIEQAFAAVRRDGYESLLLLPDPVISRQASLLAALGLKHRVATVGGSAPLARAGGLASYGPDYVESYRGAATYVVRILKGAFPGDLAIYQTRRFELVINMKTAKALGLVVPKAVLARVDEVIR